MLDSRISPFLVPYPLEQTNGVRRAGKREAPGSPTWLAPNENQQQSGAVRALAPSHADGSFGTRRWQLPPLRQVYLFAALAGTFLGACADGTEESNKLQQALQDFLAPSGTVQLQVIDGITPTLVNEARTEISEVTGIDFVPGITLAALQVPEVAMACPASPCVQGDTCLGDWTSWSVNFTCLCAHTGKCTGEGVLTQSVDYQSTPTCGAVVKTMHYQDVRFVGPNAAFRGNGEAIFATGDCADSAGETSTFSLEWFNLEWNGKQVLTGKRDIGVFPTPEVVVYSNQGSYIVRSEKGSSTASTQGGDERVTIRGSDGTADCDFGADGCGHCTTGNGSVSWETCIPK